MPIVLHPPPNPIAALFHRPAGATTHYRRRIGQWTLEVTHDPFASRTYCDLKAGAITYGPRAVSFRFGAQVNTYDAVYRIDGGPPTPWRANAMSLAADGVQLTQDDLTNPSGGLVYVPAPALTGARAIVIRPALGANARSFSLDGLPAALDMARRESCEPLIGGSAAD